MAEAGRGVLDRSIGQPGEVVVSSDFVVRASARVDGVIGLSQSGAAGLDELAAAVRLGPGGAIDAGDGAAYRADAAASYAVGEARRIRIVASVPTHTFSVYVATGEHDSVQLARRYAFRPSQAGVGWLGNLGAIVDSPRGAIAICNVQSAISIGVRMAREGNHAVAPLPGDEAIVSDGTTTLRLGSAGDLRAKLAAGGLVAADPAGNVYLARITGAALVVEAYTAGFALRWSRSVPVGAGHRALAVGADAVSVVAAAGPAAGGVDLVQRWQSDGSQSTERTGALGDAIAIGPAGYAVGSAVDGAIRVERWALGGGAPDWQRAWPGSAHIDAVTVTPSGGVALAGTFSGTIRFDGPTLTAPSSSVFVAALSPAGDPVFARGLSGVAVRGVASSGAITAVSMMHAARSPELVSLDAQGQPIHGDEGDTGFGRAGDAGAVAVSPSGRVYWNFADAWPTADSPAYPYLISLAPGV